MSFCLKLFKLISFFCAVKCWDLSLLKVSPSYYVSSIAVYKNRAYLTLPRSSCFNNLSTPTLIEVPWFTEYRYSIFRKKMYPNYKDQTWGSCRDLQDAVSVDVETKRAKLWVLDRGNKKCPAKIIIYSLHYNNIMQNSRLPGISSDNLSFIVVDPESKEFGTRAYIGGMDNQIIVFSTNNLKFWKLKFIRGENIYSPITTDYLAISKVEPVLYITGGKSSNLFSINLEHVRHLAGSQSFIYQETPTEINVTFIGHKLGPSAGIATDIKGGLNYYLTRDYAILRWDTRQPLQAEYHEVLAQSYESLPYVAHLFSGPQNGIWALVNPFRPETCSTKNKTSFVLPEDMPYLPTRVVKMMEYNKRN